MSATIIPQHFLLPQESVKLGRFITSVEHPYQNHHDPPSATQPRELVSSSGSYVAEQQTLKNSAFGSTLTSLLSAGISKRAKKKISVTTNLVITYQLDNSDNWFDEAITLPDTQRWVERQLDRGYDVYIIVGYHTISDACIAQESLVQNNTEGQAQVPADLSLAAVGAIVPVGNVMNVGVRAHNQGLVGVQSQFTAPGEKVCALEYRRIRPKWLSSKNLDQARLSKIRQWSLMERLRGDEDGEDDVLEVNLVNVKGLDDVQDLEGEWDSQVVEDNIFLVPSGE